MCQWLFLFLVKHTWNPASSQHSRKDSSSNAQACDQEFKLFFALSEKNEMTKASQEDIFFYFLSDQGIVVKLTLSDVLILVPVPLLAFLRYRKIIA